MIGELTKANVPSQKATEADPVPVAPVLVVEGEFIAIDQGNKSKRILIGFGRGASDIKVHVVVSSLYKGQRTVVLEFNLNSKSGKKPGAAATMGAGAIAVGAAAGGVGDKKATVESDASRMAKLVGKQIEAFMTAQHWTPQPVGRKLITKLIAAGL